MTASSGGAHDDVVAAKSRMREAAKLLREQLAAEFRREAAIAVAEFGIGFASARAGATVSAYRAIGAEFDPAPLLQRLAAAGHPICLPVLRPRGQPLQFRAWTPGGPLVSRLWGIEQPPETAALVEPDILLVPLLAFDAGGWRLGYGAGYYDRTLERLRSAKPVVAIGLGFDEQQVDAVPHDAHDQRLDWVLTPSGVRRCV